MKIVRLFAINLLVLTILGILIEGTSSFLLFMGDMLTTRSVAEQKHSQYDPDLGWSHIPNKSEPNMYGPGLGLTINSQGFRAQQDYTPAVPELKFRVICSGDSFTLGYGVNDDQTYCQQLEKIDKKIETINMGNGGYGLDQAYIWYKRDGIKFDHQVQLLAFITDDFYRMQYNTFNYAYGKPTLEVENGAVVVKNVPVSQNSYQFSWITNHLESVYKMRTVQLLKRIRNSFRSEPTPVEQQTSLAEDPNKNTKEVIRAMLEELKAVHQEKSSQLILVYFPIPEELTGPPPQDWIDFFEAESERLQIPLVNVIEAFRSMPSKEWDSLYIPKGQLTYPAAAGHFNEKGNKVVAEIIYKELQKNSNF